MIYPALHYHKGVNMSVIVTNNKSMQMPLKETKKETKKAESKKETKKQGE